jgi:hypothetical protein
MTEVSGVQPDLVLRVAFPQPDKPAAEEEWLDVPVSRLRAIDRAPSNPKWLRDAGLTFSFTTAGLDDAKDFRKRVREAMARGLSEDDALAAVTTIPAKQLGLQDRLGTIAPGKIANLVVETGAPFAEKSRVSEIWIDGSRIELKEEKKDEPAVAEKSAAPAAAREGRSPAAGARGGAGGAPRPSSCGAPRSGRRAAPGSSRSLTCSWWTARSPPSERT